jgi:CheY-like chemotaxis protein
VGSTVTSDPFFLGLLLIPGSGLQITAVPAADPEFGAVVRAAVTALDADEADPIAWIAARLRAAYPEADVVERHPLAAHGLASTWYAFRDGHQTTRARRRILVVDDDPSLADVIVALIDHERFDVHVAFDGQAALDAIDGWPPDLILLDLHMPVMSGDEFAVRYRQLPGPQAQIVLLTSAVDGSDVADRIAARSFVKKPFDLSVLAALLDRYA